MVVKARAHWWEEVVEAKDSGVGWRPKNTPTSHNGSLVVVGVVVKGSGVMMEAKS